MTIEQMIQTLYDQAQKYAKYVFESEVAKNPSAAYKELNIAWKNFLLLVEDKPIQDLLKREDATRVYINAIQQSFTKFKADTDKGVPSATLNKDIAAQFTKLLKAEKMTAEGLRKRGQQWIPIAIGVGALGVLWLLTRKRTS